jgi:hypothetical protein
MDDGRLEEAKAIPIEDVASSLAIEGLRRCAHELVGPCPVCGGFEKRDADRFSINPIKGVFNCRKCAKAGDCVELVVFVKGCSFKDALAFLVGDADIVISPEEQDRRKALAEERLKKQKQASDRFSQAARDRARQIWRRSCDGQGTMVAQYLQMRGIDPRQLPKWPVNIRFNSALRYYNPKARGRADLVLTGPAMVAVIADANGQGVGAHCTWLDVTQPKGKARIVYDGVVLESKKVQGTHKGGAIRLFTPDRADTLVMGEGIETTLSALVADAVPNAAYWAGVSLGNMAGKRVGRGRSKRLSTEPDMQDGRAFVPPDWVKRLVLIQDGDSDPESTEAQLKACAIRAKRLRPDLTAEIVHPGAGLDLNDLLMSGT